MAFTSGQWGPDTFIDNAGNTVLIGATVTASGYVCTVDELGNLTIVGPADDSLTVTVTPATGAAYTATVAVKPTVDELDTVRGLAVAAETPAGAQAKADAAEAAAEAAAAVLADAAEAAAVATAAVDATSKANAAEAAAEATAAAALAASEASATATFAARRAGTSLVAADLPFVNVEDFGAIGDNATDCTAAFAAAVAAVASTGGTVCVPPGIFQLDTVDLPDNESGVYLRGEGGVTTLVQRAGSTSDLVTLTGHTYIGIERLHLVGNGTSGRGIADVVTVDGGPFMSTVIRDVTITGFAGSPVDLTGADEVLFVNVWATDCGGDFLLTSCTEMTLVHTAVERCGTNGYRFVDGDNLHLFAVNAEQTTGSGKNGMYIDGVINVAGLGLHGYATGTQGAFIKIGSRRTSDVTLVGVGGNTWTSTIQDDLYGTTVTVTEVPFYTTGSLRTHGISSPGTGAVSEAFGLSSVASGNPSFAAGRSAQATQPNSTAVGNSTLANGAGGYNTALGDGAQATAEAGTALGAASRARAAYGTAVGLSADVAPGHTNSTAVGFGATTTAASQVRLGTATEKVSAPGGIGVGGTSAATTPGTVVKKWPVYDADGALLGYAALYDAIT